MSLSNPTTKTNNPVDTYLYWGGEQGSAEYSLSYGVEDDDGGVEFKELSFPQEFVYLDSEVAQIKGKTKDGVRITSNLIRTSWDLPQSEKVFNVKFAGGVDIASGQWKDIKAEVKVAAGDGAKIRYTRLLYLYSPRKDKILCLYLHGRPMRAWGEFERGLNELKGTLAITGSVMSKKDDFGKSPVPVFQFVPGISDEDYEKAIEADKRLQEYLNARIKSRGVEESEDEGENATKEDVPQTKTSDTAPSLEELKRLSGDFASVEDGVELWGKVAPMMEDANLGPQERFELMKWVDRRFAEVGGTFGRYKVIENGTVEDKDDDLPF